MKDKKLCVKCKYHGTIGSRTKDSMADTICGYAAFSHKGTCLKTVGNKLIDRRGYDEGECLLYENGAAVGREAMVIRRNKSGKGKC